MPRMKPIDVELDGSTTQIECAHKNLFPPVAAYYEEEYGPAVQQRADGIITDADFHQYNTWTRVCGMLEMGAKCLHCANCRKLVYDTQTRKKELKPVIPEEIRAMPFYRKIHGMKGPPT